MQVDKDSVKPPLTVEETYRGVAAPSRPKVGDVTPIQEMPKVCPLLPAVSPHTRYLILVTAVHNTWCTSAQSMRGLPQRS